MSLEGKGSVTIWIDPMKEGSEEAAREIFNRYWERLIALARSRLRDAHRGGNNDEDVVQSAFKSLFERARRGKFDRLEDRDDLEKLLFTITSRKAMKLIEHEGREKRDAGRTQSGEAVDGLEGDPRLIPGVAVALADEYRRLLDLLGDNLRPVALLKVEGYTNEEIAQKLGVVRETIGRKLKRIRAILAGEID